MITLWLLLHFVLALVCAITKLNSVYCSYRHQHVLLACEEVWCGLFRTLSPCHQQRALGLNMWIHWNWARNACFWEINIWCETKSIVKITTVDLWISTFMTFRQHHVYLCLLKVDQSCVGERGDPVAQMPNHVLKKEKKNILLPLLSSL